MLYVNLGGRFYSVSYIYVLIVFITFYMLYIMSLCVFKENYTCYVFFIPVKSVCISKGTIFGHPGRICYFGKLIFGRKLKNTRKKTRPN